MTLSLALGLGSILQFSWPHDQITELKVCPKVVSTSLPTGAKLTRWTALQNHLTFLLADSGVSKPAS